jgi:hypothetical protein
MSQFAYVATLTSIVLGLGIAKVLSGLGSLLMKRDRSRIYWVHALWSVNVLLFLLLNWWILFRWHTQIEWTFFLFLFILLTPVISFLLAVLLFPDSLPETTNLKEHFYRNQRWFFGLAATLPILDGIDTLLKGWSHFLDQGLIYLFTILLIFGLNVVGASTRNERYHAFFAVFFLIYIILFISINLLTLI